MKPIKDFSRGKRTVKTQASGPSLPTKSGAFTPNGKQAFKQPAPPRPVSGKGISNPAAPKPKGGKPGFTF